jgi:hypothetical protein
VCSTCDTQIYTDPEQPTVFALGMDKTQRDVLFRAPSRETRDKWLKAIAIATSRASITLASGSADRGRNI